jgi:dihydrolipoamide dehydrogenase
MLLAHVASAEGAVAAENAMGNDRVMDLTAVPTCVHISPEIAWVGVSEKEARLRPGGIRIGVFPMAGVGKAVTVGDTQGFVKVISGARYGEILGVHMVGPNVTEVISTAVAAIRLEATAEFLGEIIHPHPTISEALMEAARRAAGTSPYVVRER